MYRIVKVVITTAVFLFTMAACNQSPTTAVTVTPVETSVPIQGKIKVQLDERYQTIEGFGASGAWWA